ncbi:MAG TPA: NAD(P)H-dependent oxidoreductase [Pyrinomonadaceae bacterium]
MQKREDAEFELVDIKDFNLPLLDEPVPPSQGQYTKEHTRAWAAKIDSFDAYVFVTPDYNHSTSARSRTPSISSTRSGTTRRRDSSAMAARWARAVEHLRLVMGELIVADVRSQVGISLYTDFENFSVFKPAALQEQAVNNMLDQVIAWGGALRVLRQ